MNENLTIISVQIDGIDCNVFGNYSNGMKDLNITSCIGNVTTSTPDVIVVTNKGIYQEKLYLRRNIVNEENIENLNYTEVITALSPWVWFKLDESSGNAADSMGIVNGDVFNNPIYSQTKLTNDSGTSYHFTKSSSQWISLQETGFSVHGLTNISIEAWVKFDSIPSGPDYLSQQHILNFKDAIYLIGSQTGKLGGGIYNGTGYYGVYTIEDISIGTTYHVILTYDNTNIVLYVNGTQIGTYPVSGALDELLATPRTIGRGSDTNRYLDGNIDNVIIYNKTLTATEVLLNYNTGKLN